MNSIFITGIGTDVGKTLVAAILAEALEADYWKPVQAGFADGTDSNRVQFMISNAKSRIHPETYTLRLPASPHIAAREEGIRIDLDRIAWQWESIRSGQNEYLIIEGAGGLMAPLNEKEFVLDLIKKIGAKLIIVSRNYLGSINHSLLTATLCRLNGLDIAGWIFNDQYMHYEEEISRWSGIPLIASIPFREKPDKQFILQQAGLIAPALKKRLG